MYQKIDSTPLEVHSHFVPASFTPSKIHKAKVELIKVPKFVSEIWSSAPHKSVVGVLTKNNGSSSLVVPKGGANENGVSFFDGKKKANSNLFILQPKMRDPKHADICGFVDNLSTFVPQLDTHYHAMLRKRHLERSEFRGRSTAEEKRQEEYDSTKTLFRYYNPHQDSGENATTAEGGKKGTSDTALQRTAKSKQKKVVTMTEDTLRMRIFRMFEKAGEEGLTLKRVVIEVAQPLNFVKSVLEEIGEQRRRASDRRAVYFLKGHYASSAVTSGGHVDDSHQNKKPRFL